jgi:glutaredoxin
MPVTPLKKIRKHKDKIVIFFDYGCPYSEEALKLLQDSEKPYKAYEIEKFTKLPILVDYFSIPENSEAIKYNNKHRTKPIIFVDGKFLGGFTELKEYLNKK